ATPSTCRAVISPFRMLTSAASALVCADPTAESAMPVVIELSVLAVKVLVTAAASTSASTMPPSGGNAAPANCCVPVARFTAAAYPCPLTYGVCAAPRAAAGMRPLIAPIAASPHSHCGTPLVTMLLMSDVLLASDYQVGRAPVQSAVVISVLPLCSWMLPPVRVPSRA